MKTLIKNGTVVTATDKYKGDVFIDGETVAMIGTKLTVDADKVIDATGKLLVPGGIDAHTHLDMPFGGTNSVDDFETGTRAAAFGGTTTIVDFAIQDFGGSIREASDIWAAKARDKACIDYGFHMILREFNSDLSREMKDAVNEGITSFKLFMAYPGVFLMDDAGIFKAMQRSGEVGATICMHAENGVVIDELVRQALAKGHTAPKYHALTRPPILEGEAVNRAITLAEVADVPLYIVHLSSVEALAQVTLARDRGRPVYAETCPQYLFLSTDDYDEPDFGGSKYVMSPPLRDKSGWDELWRGLTFDDLQAVSTDHCPFCLNTMPGKRLGEHDFSKIPNGAPGIENRFSLLYDGGVAGGRFDVHRWVQVCSTSPAKIFGMFPKKGTIAPGSDADIVVFDPDAKQTISAETHHMNVDFNCYEGRTVQGVSEIVLSRGEVLVENGTFHGRPGRGSYVKRAPRS